MLSLASLREAFVSIKNSYKPFFSEIIGNYFFVKYAECIFDEIF